MSAMERARDLVAGFTAGCIEAGDCRDLCDGVCRSRVRAIAAALEAERRAALEEAAQLCDRYFDSHARFVAPAIRKLALGEPAP
jgi:hypothetical protein